MRVLQVIDSLQPGGAERMALSYAELLHKNGHASYLCSTRFEGILKENLSSDIGYLFLNKKSSLDIIAFLKLRNFIKKNEIEIVHAHSTSYFFASLLKLSGLPIKVVWHDHYGESEVLKIIKSRILKLLSTSFDGIISVNKKLKDWAIENLMTKNVVMINNFVPDSQLSNFKQKLKGPEESFKIICLANLRPQKDHLNLIRAFEKLSEKISTTLHLIGNDPNTSYSTKIFQYISNSEFRNQIFYYGIQKDVIQFLRLADLGVLASRSEGLPVALLEYGLAGIPVVVTDVGECKEVLNNFGICITANDSELLSESIFHYSTDKFKREKDAVNFQNHIYSKFGEDVIYEEVISFYKNL